MPFNKNVWGLPFAKNENPLYDPVQHPNAAEGVDYEINTPAASAPTIAPQTQPAPPPAGYGQFTAGDDREKTVEDYMAEFENYAALQEKVAANAIGRDPRIRTSRAQRALQNIFSASTAYKGTDEASIEQGVSKAQDDIFTLLDPTAWIADKAQTADPGDGGELEYTKDQTYVKGQPYTTRDGKVWRFEGSESILEMDHGQITGSHMKNKFTYVGDTKLLQEIAQGYKDQNLLKGADKFLSTNFGGQAVRPVPKPVVDRDLLY